MEIIVLDTDVLSLIYRKRVPREMKALLRGRLRVSAITIGELWKGARKAQWSEHRVTALWSCLKGYRIKVLNVDANVGQVWGDLAIQAQRDGATLPVNDSWIAATCLAHGYPLLTLNVKDFERVPGLTLRG